jgi:hypothetical protein
MPKYVIEWTNEDWYRMEVEAESKEAALDNFWSGKYNWDNATTTGGEVQENVDVWEAE